MEAALASPNADAIGAVIAAADVPAVFHDRHPQSSRLLLQVNRNQLLGADVSDEVAAELAELDQALIGILVSLAQNLWCRRDGQAVDAITLCVVDLSAAFLLSRNRIESDWARSRLTSAVRAALAEGPPTRTRTKE